MQSICHRRDDMLSMAIYRSLLRNAEKLFACIFASTDDLLARNANLSKGAPPARFRLKLGALMIVSPRQGTLTIREYLAFGAPSPTLAAHNAVMQTSSQLCCFALLAMGHHWATSPCKGRESSTDYRHR